MQDSRGTTTRQLEFASILHAKLLQSCPTLCDPHGVQPTRLLCPWDFPSKNTRAGCHFLLQRIEPLSHVSCIGRWVLYHQCHLDFASSRTFKTHSTGKALSLLLDNPQKAPEVPVPLGKESAIVALSHKMLCHSGFVVHFCLLGCPRS